MELNPTPPNIVNTGGDQAAEQQPKRNFFLIISIIFIAAVLLAAIAYFTYSAVNYSRAQTFFEQGKSYYEQGDFEKAEENFKNSIRYYSKNPLPYAYLGSMVFPKFSEPVLENLLAARGAFIGGNSNYYDEFYGKTLNYYEKAFSLGLAKEKFPDYIPLLHGAATAYRILGEDEKATEKYLEEIRLNPDFSFWARFWVARDYYGRANKPKEALDMMTSAINSKDADTNHLYRAYSSLSNYYKYFDDDLNAEKYAQLALQSVPQNQTGRDEEVEWIHVLLAELAGRRGDITLAEQEVKKADELAGGEVYMCELAEIYYWSGLLDKAIAEAGKTVNPESKGSFCVWTLGMANLKKGENGEAKKYLENFLRLAEQSKVESVGFFKKIEEVQVKLKEIQ